MNKIIKLSIGLVLMGFIVTNITVSNNMNVEAKVIKLKDYTDPYNRYTIKYPAKWSVQSVPVHTEGILQTLNEVPFIVGDNKGSTLSVTELEKPPTLSLREFASTVQNGMLITIKRVITPVTCVGEIACYYFYAINSYGLYDEIGQMVSLYSGKNGNKVFMVTATFSAGDKINEQQFSDIEDTFSLSTTVTKANNCGYWDTDNTIPVICSERKNQIIMLQ